MNNTIRRFTAIIIAVALIAGGFIGAKILVKTKPKAERTKPMSSMIPVVETIPLVVSDRPLIVEGLGTVIADQSVEILPEVSGKIVSKNDLLVEGGHVKKGDELIQIDATDYQLAIDSAKAALLTAQSNLRIEEGEQAVAQHEVELIDETGEVDESYRDLMLREPQLQAAQANVANAEAALQSAYVDLDRTSITAPFDAVVISADADVGDYAQGASVLVELAATDRYFIKASVPLSALEPLPKLGTQPYSAELILSDESTRSAQTHKLLPNLTETGRMAQLLLVVESPYSSQSNRPLLLNEMVRFRVQGEIAKKTALIPRSYLRDGDVVWMMDHENKLRIVPAQVLQGYAKEVLIRVEGADEMELITTDLAAAVEGMELKKVKAKAPAEKSGAENE